MKTCNACHKTSPNDASWCIECGASFAVTGRTERLHNEPDKSGTVLYDMVWLGGDASGSIVVFSPWRTTFGYRVGFGSADSLVIGGLIS